MLKRHLQTLPQIKKTFFMHFYTHHWTKNICAKLYTLSKCVASVFIDYSFQDHDWLKSCHYVSHTEKATLKTTTQKTSYINHLQLWQAQLRSKCSLRWNYLVMLLKLVHVTKSGSRSILFLQKELLKNFDVTCIYAMSAVDPKLMQMLSTIVTVQITSSD